LILGIKTNLDYFVLFINHFVANLVLLYFTVVEVDKGIVDYLKFCKFWNPFLRRRPKAPHKTNK